MHPRTIIATVLAAGAPIAAQQPPNPLTMTTDAADRTVMDEVASVIATRTPSLTRLDAVLTKLPRATPLRGMVQAVRAHVLWRADNNGAAVTAIEEALRLLPDDPRPKLIAAQIFTFTGAPQRAADLWLQASRESADVARMTEPYYMDALVGRLRDLGDHARADRVRSRLGEIGFSATEAPQRSAAALARTRMAIREDRSNDALSSLTAISDPDDLLSLYIDKRYATLWPRIAEWAGNDFEEQSGRYLRELRADWDATNDMETAKAYARQLASLNAHEAVVSLFLPVLDRIRPDAFPGGVEFLTPVVTRSLTHTGRAADAEALLGKITGALPADYGINALNFDGAYVNLAMDQADWPHVISRADVFLARAKAAGPDVNASATIQVSAMRACALWRTGRTVEAQKATADVLLYAPLMPAPAMQLHLCRGDVPAARALVIARLDDEGTRDWALRMVQPARSTAVTALERLTFPVEQAVRTAPDVVAAVDRVGRILPRAVNTMLPAGFDPFRVPPRSQLPDPSTT